MHLDAVWEVADRARTERRLSAQDIALVRKVFPAELDAFPKLVLPKSIRHPGGFTVSGAPVGTFLRSSLLLAAQKALGDRFSGMPFYERVERDLAFGIMRS